MQTNQTLSKTDLIFLLLYSRGSQGQLNEPIGGITRLMKLLFLLKVEGKINDLFKFEPYKMGPFSSDVYPEIDFLKNSPSPDKPFLHINEMNENDLLNPEQIKFMEDAGELEDAPFSPKEVNIIFSLSDIGEKVAAEIWRGISLGQQNAIEEIKQKYSGLSLRDLLRYVYKNYPEMTTRSEIKDTL
jgi:hypothetical protein